MSLWFKPDVFKLKKDVPAIGVERPFCFGSVIFTLWWLLGVSINNMFRYAARIFIVKIIIVSIVRIGTLNAMVPLAFITMAFGFDQHRNSRLRV